MTKGIVFNWMKKIIGIILIVSAMLSIYNLGFNGHYHKMANGLMVLHYHPYSDTSGNPNNPFKKHTHSELDFFQVMMNNITVTLLPALIVAMLAILTFKKIKYNIPIIYSSFTSFINSCSSLRAPPQFL